MRLRFTLLLAATLAGSAFSQSKLVQGFEPVTYPPTGWTLTYSGILYWERTAVGGYGTSSASTIFRFFQASGSEIQSLTTLTFAATVSGDSLAFDHAYATYEFEVDSLIVESSTDSGTSFTRLIALQGGPTVGTGMVTAPPFIDDFVPTSAQWGTKKYALPIGTNKIRFTAKSAFGNNLYLDNIRVGQAYANDVSVAAIVAPRYFINMPFAFTPRATITNIGTSSQTIPFSTTMNITGPGGYSYSNSKADSLSAGLSRDITFDAAPTPTIAGVYSVVCYSNLTSDQSRANDTARSTVTAANYNYGTNGAAGNDLSYFVNSLSGNGAPLQPAFAWRDTSGSIDLIVDGTAVQPITGDVDDGYFTIVNVFPGKRFRLYGINHSDTIYVSTNGILSFNAGYGYGFHQPDSGGVPNGAAPNGAIFALWTDIDFGNSAVPINRLSYKIDGDLFVVTYARAPRFTFDPDANDFVSFQVCLRFSSDTTRNSFASVQFDSSRTGSSFFAGYSNNTFRHLIGSENDPGTSAVRYRHVHNGTQLVPGPMFGSSLALTMGPAYGSEVQLSVKALLEGPYSTVLHSMLNESKNSVPLVQPFTGSPWNYTGLERTLTIPDSAVDWVLVKLRTGTGTSTESAQRAGLLLRNGSIVESSGASALRFELVPPGNYYGTVVQRNHLPVMTPAPLSLSGSPIAYDFTFAQTQAYGTNPMNQLESGVFGMVAGDVNSSSTVTAQDVSNILNATQTSGYVLQDANVTGIVSSADANLAIGNLNRTSQVPASSPSPGTLSTRVILDPHPTAPPQGAKDKSKMRTRTRK